MCTGACGCIIMNAVHAVCVCVCVNVAVVDVCMSECVC